MVSHKEFYKFLLLISGILLLSACAQNPYTQFYKGQQISVLDPRLSEDNDFNNIKVLKTDQPIAEVNNLYKKGYLVIGESHFNHVANSVNDAALLVQAKKVGASVVVLGTRYMGTETSNMPLYFPTTNVSTYNANSNIYGRRGVTNVNTTGTVTTQTNNVVNVPISRVRNEYLAVYLVKSKTKIGVNVAAVPDVLRQERESNSGVIITTVIDESRAFKSDILVNDVIEKINGETIYSVQDFQKIISDPNTTKYVIVIDRKGKKLSKTINLE